MDESWHGPEGAKGYFSVKSDQDAASVYRECDEALSRS